MHRQIAVKPWYKSLTLQGAGVTGISSIAAIAAYLAPAANCAEEFGKSGVADALRGLIPVTGLIGTVMAGAGKVRTGTVYTPEWAPGPTRREGGGS